MPTPWYPSTFANGLSIFQENYSVQHDRSLTISIPIADSYGEPLSDMYQTDYNSFMLSTSPDDGSAFLEAELLVETGGILDRIFNCDFTNELAVGKYYWSAYYAWETFGGSAQLVGFGTLEVFPDIGFGLIPPPIP